MSNEEAQAFVDGWLRAWNTRNLEALVSHYAEDAEFQSLLVIKVLGEPSGVIRGHARLREYFSKLLAAFPGSPELEVLGVFRGVGSIVVQFQSKGRRAAEVMEFNGEAKVRRAMAHPAI